MSPATDRTDDLGRFARHHLLATAIERLWSGARWAEGPVWLGDLRCLLFSDIPNERILFWAEATGTVPVLRAPSGSANGNTRDRQGRRITCEQETRRVTRTEIDGRLTVLLDRFDGKRLNAPNDVVVHPDGHVWLSDPGYRILSNYEGEVAELELPTRVYRLDPRTGRATVAVEELTRPNGLGFSPDHSRLYVVDTGCTDDPAHHRQIMVHEVRDDGRVGKGRPVCDLAPARSAGIRCDMDGNLWAASGFGGPASNGMRVFAPDGAPIGMIHLPEPVAKLCFGGRKRNRLFVTASQSLHALYVEAQGVPYG